MNGPINLLATGAGVDGETTIDHLSAIAPIVNGLVQPPANIFPHDTCTAFNVPVDCLDPCPTCGNGLTEWPEDCDSGAMLHCMSGCSHW